MVSIIIAIIAIVAGFFYIKKFSSIENYFFKNDEAESGIPFLFLAVLNGALSTGWGVINEIFNLHFNQNMITYVSVSLLAITISASLAYVAFHSESSSQMAGKMLFMIISCIIGAIVGVAGSIILLGILMLLLLFFVLKAAVSGTGSSGFSSSGSSSSNSSSESDEMEISVDGEMFNRRARDVGFGEIRDDHGDSWTKNFDGSLSRKD